MARRPLEKEHLYLDGGRRTTQLMRDSLDGGLTSRTMAGTVSECTSGWSVESPMSRRLPLALRFGKSYAYAGIMVELVGASGRELPA